MAQQPNVELTEAKRPRRSLEPGPAVKWRAEKPGVPQGPQQVIRGGAFGITGPDPGWAWRVVAAAELPDDDPRLKSVVVGLVMARAAALGRGAVAEDVEAALALCGFGEEDRPDLEERRERWLAAASHDQRPGATAVSEIDIALLLEKPERIRRAQRHS